MLKGLYEFFARPEVAFPATYIGYFDQPNGDVFINPKAAFFAVTALSSGAMLVAKLLKKQPSQAKPSSQDDDNQPS